MSLVVEDGSGLSTAEAYISVANVTTYLTSVGKDAAWTALTTAAQEVAIRKATQYLDARYSGRWIGQRRTQGQALAWPRVYAYDPDGYMYASNALPAPLTKCTAELALIASSTDLTPTLTSPGTVKTKREKLGPMEEETTYVGGQSPFSYFTIAEELIRPLVTAAQSVTVG